MPNFAVEGVKNDGGSSAFRGLQGAKGSAVSGVPPGPGTGGQCAARGLATARPEPPAVVAASGLHRNRKKTGRKRERSNPSCLSPSFLPSFPVVAAPGGIKRDSHQEVPPLVLPSLPPVPLCGLDCWENLFVRVWKLDLRPAVLGSGTEASRSICRLMPHFPEHLFPQPTPCVVRILGKGSSYLLCDL